MLISYVYCNLPHMWHFSACLVLPTWLRTPALDWCAFGLCCFYRPLFWMFRKMRRRSGLFCFGWKEWWNVLYWSWDQGPPCCSSFESVLCMWLIDWCLKLQCQRSYTSTSLLFWRCSRKNNRLKMALLDGNMLKSLSGVFKNQNYVMNVWTWSHQDSKNP